MSKPRECPVCSLVNPSNALRCDCGYDFDSKQVEAPFANVPLSQLEGDATKSNLPSLFLFVLLAFLLRGLGLPAWFIGLVVVLSIGYFIFKKLRDDSIVAGGEITSERFIELMAPRIFMFEEDNHLAPLTRISEKIAAQIAGMSKKEITHLSKEMAMIDLFCFTYAYQKHVPNSVLDSTLQNGCSKLKKKGLVPTRGFNRFNQVLTERYTEYYEALSNQSTQGPVGHFGSKAFNNLFGDKYKKDIYLYGAIKTAIPGMLVAHCKAAEKIMKKFTLVN